MIEMAQGIAERHFLKRGLGTGRISLSYWPHVSRPKK